ncbi:hypothetical protein E4U42_005046 [Claviceps africana]|uniref:DUF7907 domain-containing protein n=1 Tax=Claviceps africana TaxID=83212 RepID=A0A8K0NGJ9_9HYPO|nr:hypothetical protein E4U42_005046 [Claviceps africana]
MKAPALLLALAAASGLAAGANNISKPFNLVIKSSDKGLNGQAFGQCHTGAGIESMCLIKGYKSTYFLETWQDGEEPDGFLECALHSQPPTTGSMSFHIDPSSNVALPLFSAGAAGAGQLAGFDKKGELKIKVYVEDTTLPPGGTPPRALKHWYVCDTYFQAYSYKTLAWVLGVGKPQNPSCVKVQVRREFI